MNGMDDAMMFIKRVQTPGTSKTTTLYILNTRLKRDRRNNARTIEQGVDADKKASARQQQGRCGKNEIDLSEMNRCEDGFKRTNLVLKVLEILVAVVFLLFLVFLILVTIFVQ